MATIETAPYREAIERPAVEPLNNGDLLCAAEFLRRYEATPEVKKAELIDGIVYMGSPVSISHGAPDAIMSGWLTNYAAQTPGTQSACNVTVRLDADNVVQPDALLRILPEYGGRSRPDEKDYIIGPPEMVVEIATSSTAIDLHGKLRAYRRAGVGEYLVWRTSDRILDWFILEKDQYHGQQLLAAGILQSTQFPGLVLDVNALIVRDTAKVLAALQNSLKEPGHASFVEALAKNKRA